ncbi:MAG TPA: ADOP family duplicated permease [Vicinamibacterales bacterium]|jgi:putative ABC transport system permease protein|nr:ADOP family duplicated permease [Vicinamibacterales bacterium]
MPRWMIRLHVALRSLVRRSRFERDLDEEMRFHLDREIQERMKTGQSEMDARRAAWRAMGAIEGNKDACRDLRTGERLANAARGLVQDVRFAWRLFRRRPSPVVMAIGGLALAIGVATAAFSLVNASLLRPYAMDDPSSVVSVSRIGEPAWIGLPYAQYVRMHDGATMTAVEAARPERVRFSTAPATDGLANRPMLFVSGGYLRMLGGRPFLGRMLDASDDTPAAPAAIVVSHRFWETALDGDPSLVGRTVWIDDAPATLVGVMRPDFTGPVRTPVSIWATLAAVDDVRAGTALTPDAKTSVEVVARLGPGATLSAAQAELTAISSRSRAPGSTSGNPRSSDVWLQSATSPLDADSGGDTYAILICAIGIVVLILALACANVANLLLAAAMTRAREVGVRLALGASRGRLVRQMISESALLGLIAGAVGLLLAHWMTPILGAVVQMPSEIDLAPDGRVLIFATAVALVCGVSAGLSPARFGARGNVVSAVQAGGGSRGAAGIPSRLRTTFVGAQAAMSMLLLVTTALLGRSAMRMARTDAGFDADRLLAVQFDMRPGPDEIAYIDAARDAVRAIPSVEHVSVIQNAPWGCCIDRYRATSSFEIHVERTDAEFFATSGVRIVRGRGFTSDDVASGAPVALISENVARAFFRGLDPIGQPLSTIPPEGTSIRDRPAIIVGVVADALMSWIGSENAGTIVRPIARQRDSAPALIVRTATPGITARLVEDALRRVNDRITPRTSVVQDGLDAFLGGKQRLMWLLVPTAVLALVLAALGVYGVTTFVVGERMDEVSVRMAIGASAADILRLLVADSLRPVVIGLVVGLGAALLVARALAGELGGVSPYDPTTIVTAIAILAACALVAVLVPARRAAKTDPAALLRHA